MVLDTDVVIAAMRSPRGGASLLLDLASRQEIIPVVTTTLLLQYQEVCRRPQHMTVAGLDGDGVELFLAGLQSIALEVAPDTSRRPLVRDPGDDMVMEAAIAGQAAAIVTFNKRDFGDTPAAHGIALFRPGELLEELRR